MADFDKIDYLQDGFDPWSLTVPRLRSILVTHNVQYPATAKKSQLIDLFTAHVVPQAKKLLAVRARAKRTSQGIFDADSQSTNCSDMFDEEPIRPPPRSTRNKSPRKTTRVDRGSDEPDMAPPSLRTSPRKRQSQSASAQPMASDTDTGPDHDAARSTTKTRTSRRAAPAVVKLEPPIEDDDASDSRVQDSEESVFTSDNPFQSGSSPPSAAKNPTHRRRTTGTETGKTEPASAAASRRRTDGPTYGGNTEHAFITKSNERPYVKPKSRQAPTPLASASTIVEAGEEFTPEEQWALEQDVQAHPALAMARQKPRPARQTGKLSTPLWVFLATLMGVYAAWYRQEKIAVGYCGVGRQPSILVPSTLHLQDVAERLPAWARDVVVQLSLPAVDIPGWAISLVQPECEPCPQHATCSAGLTAWCDADYLKQCHPLSLGGLVPIPPTCEPDGEKVRRVKLVADRAMEELRERRARYECGEEIDQGGQQLESPAMDEGALKSAVNQKRKARMNSQEFDDLWNAALAEVKARGEVEVVEKGQRDDETGHVSPFPTTFLSSTSLARLSYACTIRRSVQLGLARYRLLLAGLIMSPILFLVARSRYRAHRALAAKIPVLVEHVLERLSTQKELAFDVGEDDAFLFLSNLRDDVLRHYHRLQDRERIWRRVRVVVEQNSNVRTGQREGRNGEVGRAWEWIGPTRPRLEDGSGGALSSGRRRKSARGSWDPELQPPATKGGRAGMPETAEHKAAAHKKWEESRPIY